MPLMDLSPAFLSGHPTRKELYSAIDILTEAFQAMKARVDAVEAHGVKYLGSFQRAQTYKRGSVVTHEGNMWVCLADSAEGVTPGTAPAFWQLSAKGGKPVPAKRMKAGQA